MIYQLHWQFLAAFSNSEKDRFEFVSQREISTLNDLDEWMKETQFQHPLPEGAIWMVCNKNSKHFMGTISDGEGS